MIQHSVRNEFEGNQLRPETSFIISILHMKWSSHINEFCFCCLLYQLFTQQLKSWGKLSCSTATTVPLQRHGLSDTFTDTSTRTFLLTSVCFNYFPFIKTPPAHAVTILVHQIGAFDSFHPVVSREEVIRIYWQCMMWDTNNGSERHTLPSLSLTQTQTQTQTQNRHRHSYRHRSRHSYLTQHTVHCIYMYKNSTKVVWED
jgi:hypothetical protein